MNNKADYIISLVGTNSLPSFLSIISNGGINTKIFLIYTGKTSQNIGTEKTTKNLMNVIKEKLPDIWIDSIETDKSNIEVIGRTIQDLKKRIGEDIKEHGIGKRQRKLVLDYTGGTKVMSVIFCDGFLKTNINDLEIVISYLYDNSECFIENTKSSVFTEKKYIKDFFALQNIDFQDITKIHGYRTDNTINMEHLKSNKGNDIAYISSKKKDIVFKNIYDGIREIKVNSLAFSNARLIMCFESALRNKNKADYKRELFEIKDMSEKLGGGLSRFIYKCDCKDKVIADLKKDLKRAYEYEMEKRLHIVKDTDSFTDYLKGYIEYF